MKPYFPSPDRGPLRAVVVLSTWQPRWSDVLSCVSAVNLTVLVSVEVRDKKMSTPTSKLRKRQCRSCLLVRENRSGKDSTPAIGYPCEVISRTELVLHETAQECVFCTHSGWCWLELRFRMATEVIDKPGTAYTSNRERE